MVSSLSARRSIIGSFVTSVTNPRRDRGKPGKGCNHPLRLFLFPSSYSLIGLEFFAFVNLISLFHFFFHAQDSGIAPWDALRLNSERRFSASMLQGTNICVPAVFSCFVQAFGRWVKLGANLCFYSLVHRAARSYPSVSKTDSRGIVTYVA